MRADNLVNELHQEYCESLNGWRESLDSVQKHYADVVKKNWPGTKYVVRNLPFAPEKLVICPPYSSLNMAPNQQHCSNYATGLFEGLSAEAVINAHGKITSINLILLQPRIQRFIRSLKARSYTLPVPIENFAQSILDLVAIHGEDIVTNDDGSPGRAYIRPSAGPGVGVWGASLKSGYFIEASNLVFRCGNCFSDMERVYFSEGAKIAITGARRMFPITGKHSSNYGSAAVDGAHARSLQYDELLYLAPYGIKNGAIDYSINNFDQLITYGALADGPGEEIFGVLKDGETIVYPPMRVNRLGGTVLDYVTKHLAPRLGLKVCECDITLQQIRDNEIAALAFAGNAVRIVPIGLIDILESSDNQVKKVETLVKFNIHPTITAIRDQYFAELIGKKPPSHESLLTPIDLEWGREFKAYLDEFWQKQGFYN